MANELKVLVVDDDDMIRSVVRIALQKVDSMVVFEAADGPEALLVSAANQPDVILLDFQMPEMNGAETLKRLRADPATTSIPIIFLTAKTGRKARREYMQMGAIGTIEKPFEPLALGKEILSVLAGATGA
jgi:two-component system OmpR family response regulator